MPKLENYTFIDIFNIDSSYTEDYTNPENKFPMRIHLNEMQPKSYKGLREICLSEFSSSFPWAYGYKHKDQKISGVILLEINSKEVLDKVLSDITKIKCSMSPAHTEAIKVWASDMHKNISGMLEVIEDEKGDQETNQEDVNQEG